MPCGRAYPENAKKVHPYQWAFITVHIRDNGGYGCKVVFKRSNFYLKFRGECAGLHGWVTRFIVFC